MARDPQKPGVSGDKAKSVDTTKEDQGRTNGTSKSERPINAGAKTAEQDREVARQMSNLVEQTLKQMEPVCKEITTYIEKADRTPHDELDEEKLVQDLKPLIEEGNRVLRECNGAITGLDPDGRIAATARAGGHSGTTAEEHRLAGQLKDLTTTVVKTIDDAKKRVSGMPHASKELSPLWSLLTEPLVHILAAVGLLLTGVLGLVGQLLRLIGLQGLVRGIFGGLGIPKLMSGLGLGSIAGMLGLEETKDGGKKNDDGKQDNGDGKKE